MSLSSFLRRAAVPVALAFAVAAGAAWAANEPANVIKYRKNLMKAVGGHIANIGAVVKGEVDFRGDMKPNADAIVDLLMAAGHVFPEGSGTGDTKAKPEIWSDRAKFDRALADSLAAARQLAAVAGGGDMAAVGAAMGGLGKSCGGCHRPFRAR